MQEFLEIERNNELQQRQEFEMAKVQKHNREKVLPVYQNACKITR